MNTSHRHFSAVIHRDSLLEDGVRVAPFVVVEADVEVGAGTSLLAGTVLQSGSRIGKNCKLGPYATVGGEPMDARYRGEDSYAVLEDDVVLRDFATVHRATGPGAETRVGKGTLVMSYGHVSHNVQVGRDCILTTSVQLGGHVEVGDFAYLGSTALVHQFARVGSHAILGAGSAANRDILPYSMARGNPARHYRLNRVGLQRTGIQGDSYKALEGAVRAFRRRDWPKLEALAAASEEVRLMVEFKASSSRGICAFV